MKENFFYTNTQHLNLLFFGTLLFLISCTTDVPKSEISKKEIIERSQNGRPSIIILGTVQDGGSPHIGCKKDCCRNLFLNPDKSRKIISLGLIDPENKADWLFEASPDISTQLKSLKNQEAINLAELPNGVFLTHAHIGHYTGLMYLGKEAMNANNLPVFVMPKMKLFLEENGPWCQLVNLANIQLKELQAEQSFTLSSHLSVTSFTVPHRDEFSETVGYIISGPTKKALFIPDIDKWSKWNKDIVEEIQKVDYAFIDGTFYDAKEINNRNIAEIPHPFVIESMELFKSLSKTEKDKIYFIHFNHTNPLLDKESIESKTLLKNGFHAAEVYQRFKL